jgi:hypothetical protein
MDVTENATERFALRSVAPRSRDASCCHQQGRSARGQAEAPVLRTNLSQQQPPGLLSQGGLPKPGGLFGSWICDPSAEAVPVSSGGACLANRSTPTVPDWLGRFGSVNDPWVPFGMPLASRPVTAKAALGIPAPSTIIKLSARSNIIGHILLSVEALDGRTSPPLE